MDRVENFTPGDSSAQPTPPSRSSKKKEKKIWFEAWKPSQFISYQLPDDFILAGDCHLTRGGITVIGGAPGVGKSRAALGLAVAGHRGEPWMGLQVHNRFKTLVIQAENGPHRLKLELGDIQEQTESDLDESLLITPPLRYGLAFNELEFIIQVKEWIKAFEPGLLIIDPWNRASQGDRQADAQAALEGLFACLPDDQDKRPAILIIHHLRKKSAEHARKQGRDLLHELAGTYQLGSSARCVFALEAASSDPEDQRVVLTCCKNNDGDEGAPSAWHRKNGLFSPCEDFNWKAFHSGESPANGVPLEKVKSALCGISGVRKKQAVKALMDKDVCGRTAAYDLLKKGLPFLEEDEEGKLWYRDTPE